MGVGGGVYSDEGFDGFTFFTFVVILLQRKLVNRCRAVFILQFHQIISASYSPEMCWALNVHQLPAKNMYRFFL